MSEKDITSFGVSSKERVERAIKDLQEGKGILLVDDEDRENEGDIIYAASQMSVADMALMIRACSGIVCLCLTDQKCQELNLPPMVQNNNSKNQTAFTVSIEAREGVTTGVSAADRITTIRTAIKEGAQPEDLARPGHVFPLRAKANGVFERRGHTEGSIDIVRLAGLGDSAVLSEVTNEDGTMARLPEIIDFAMAHEMCVLTIEDICQYRAEVEKKEVLEESLC
ncbi:MAG: 3,4-dihydroxy-2-butanone-4-phosphate synthase [Prolixibacteraceae bacterium]